MPLYKNKEWLYNKYVNEKLTSNQISKMCDIKEVAICNWLRKFNIPIRSRSEASHLSKVNHCNLSQETIEWINGELLGDGSLQSFSKYSAKFTYGSKYKEYIEYVSNTLNYFGIEQVGKIYKRKDNNYSYASRAYPELLPIYKKWYPKGRKIVPRDIELTPLVARQWYIGDGCLIHHKKGKPNINLATCSFTIFDVNWLVKQLVNIGLKTTRLYSSNTIHIWSRSTKKFLEYVGQPKVMCYKYKWEY